MFHLVREQGFTTLGDFQFLVAECRTWRIAAVRSIAISIIPFRRTFYTWLASAGQKTKKREEITSTLATSNSHLASSQSNGSLTFEDEQEEETVYEVKLDTSIPAVPQKLTLVDEPVDSPTTKNKEEPILEDVLKPVNLLPDIPQESEVVEAVSDIVTESQVDENDNTLTPTTKNKDKNALKLVLLLMDAKSRHFELSQLSFDAENGSVKDVLSQVSSSATEDALREQVYVSVCQ